MGFTDSVFGKPPETQIHQTPATRDPGYGFAHNFFNSLLGMASGTPFPSYGGRIDPGLSPTMQQLLRQSQGYAGSGMPEMMAGVQGSLGRFMNPSFINPNMRAPLGAPNYFPTDPTQRIYGGQEVQQLIDSFPAAAGGGDSMYPSDPMGSNPAGSGIPPWQQLQNLGLSGQGSAAANRSLLDRTNQLMHGPGWPGSSPGGGNTFLHRPNTIGSSGGYPAVGVGENRPPTTSFSMPSGGNAFSNRPAMAPPGGFGFTTGFGGRQPDAGGMVSGPMTPPPPWASNNPGAWSGRGSAFDWKGGQIPMAPGNNPWSSSPPPGMTFGPQGNAIGNPWPTFVPQQPGGGGGGDIASILSLLFGNQGSISGKPWQNPTNPFGGPFSPMGKPGFNTGGATMMPTQIAPVLPPNPWAPPQSAPMPQPWWGGGQ